MTSRFALVHTLAQQRRAEAAERDVRAHALRCRTCIAGKDCSDRKVLELVAAVHGSKAIAQ